jgi:hypothetical protein
MLKECDNGKDSAQKSSIRKGRWKCPDKWKSRLCFLYIQHSATKYEGNFPLNSSDTKWVSYNSIMTFSGVSANFTD